jgi:hypothetical protein
VFLRWLAVRATVTEAMLCLLAAALEIGELFD